jgi:hypothetical protein
VDKDKEFCHYVLEVKTFGVDKGVLSLCAGIRNVWCGESGGIPFKFVLEFETFGVDKSEGIPFKFVLEVGSFVVWAK